MSAASLSAALRAAGLSCDVEAHDRLAVIAPRDGHVSFADVEHRRVVLALAREHGFTHAAVEVASTDSRATLHRD